MSALYPSTVGGVSTFTGSVLFLFFVLLITKEKTHRAVTDVGVRLRRLSFKILFTLNEILVMLLLFFWLIFFVCVSVVCVRPLICVYVYVYICA